MPDQITEQIRLPEEIDPATFTVYTGCFFYADCDPYGHIIAATPEIWQDALDKEIAERIEEDRRDCDSPDHDDCSHEADESGNTIPNTDYDPNCEICAECRSCNADIRYVGPFAETLADAHLNSETDDTLDEWVALLQADPKTVIYG